MNDIFIYMITFAVVIAIFWGLVNFFTNGFITIFMKMKASRGKKILVKVRGRIQDYFRIGISQDGFLIFKDLNKETRRITIPSGSIYRCLNVYWVDVDEETNSIVDKDFKNVSGYDAVKWNNHLEQALHKPNPNAENTQIIIILIVVCLSLLLIIAVLISSSTAHTNILSAIQKSASVIGSNVGGSI